MVSLNSSDHFPCRPVSSQEDGQPLDFEGNNHENVDEVPQPDDPQNDLSSVQQEDCISYTPEELYEHLRSLLAENVKLREKLEKSHDIMKEQIEVISVWNEQITKSDIKHKSEIGEFLKENQELRKENEEFKTKIIINEAKIEELKNNFLINEAKIEENIKDDQEMFSQPCSNGVHSLATIVADDESDYAIIVQEDFLSLNSCTNAELKKVLKHCDELQKKMSSVSTEFTEEKFKTKNLEKILEQKEEELQNIRQKQDDLTFQSTQTLSMVTCHEEENKNLSAALKEAQSKMISLLEDLKLKQAKIQDLEKILEQKEEELRNLKKKQDDLTLQSTQSWSMVTSQEEENKKLSATLKDTQDKMASLLEDLKLKQTKLEDVQTSLNSKKVEFEALEEKYKEMTMKNNENMSLLSVFDEGKKDLLSTIQKLEYEVSEASSMLEIKQKEIIQFEKRVCESEDESEKLKKKCMEKEQYISELIAEKSKYFDQRENLRSLRSKCDSLLVENESMKKNAKELEIRNCELAQAIRDLQLELRNATDEFRNELRATKKQCEVAELNYQLLNNEYKAVKDIHNQKGNYQSFNGHSDNASEILVLQDKVNELLAKLMHVEDERNIALQTIEQLQENLKMTCKNSEQISLLKKQNEECERELNKERLSRKEAESNYDSALQEIAELNDKLPKSHHGRKHKLSRRGNQFQQSANKEVDEAESFDSSPEEMKILKNECCMCPLSFDTTEALENHVQSHFDDC